MIRDGITSGSGTKRKVLSHLLMMRILLCCTQRNSSKGKYVLIKTGGDDYRSKMRSLRNEGTLSRQSKDTLSP